MNFADKMRKKQQQEPYMNPQLARPPLLDHGIVTTSQHQADYLPTNKDPKESRKDAERKRRVKHNQLFDKIGKLVLGVVSNADKNTIMRCAVAEIRKNMTLGSDENFLPLQVNSRVDLGQFIDNYVKGFVIVVTTVGNIVYVSKSVEDHLSYTPRDLEGCSLYDLVYRKDHEVINENLTLSEADRASLFSMHQATDMSTDSSAFLRRNFEFRMLRNDKSKQKEKKYECVSISGHFKVARKALEFIQTNPGQKNTNDIVFVGVAQVLMKQSVTAVSIMDAHKDEYVTRHLVDGRILFCDQRVSTVTGYMAHEVTGLCAFEFMHADDYKWPIAALRQMYDRSETCGSSCYRLRQKTGKFIFLYTHGYLEYDDKGKVISYVCINTLVSAEVGSKLVKEMKIKFAATVTPPELAEPMIQNREKPAIAEIASSSQQTAGEITKEDPMQFRETIAQLVNRFNSPGLEKELPISPVSPVSQIVPDQYNVKQEDVLSSGTIVEPQRPLKRKHRDDDLRTTPNKKTCPSVDMTGEQVSLPYVDCGSSVVENFNHADTSPSSLKIVETSNSTLDQTSINCQQSLLNTGDDFRDLTGDSLHSLDLDTNPDIMMLDGNVPICILQQVANDAISNQLMRIENNMKSQESELSVLFSQCMKNPELETMMKRLIMSLQDEHKTQEILLKILQQEHNEIQYKKCEA